MKEGILYKYLDIKGGELMLKNSNLQYTNAAKFNDPFDCHPKLIDFSNVPQELCRLWGEDFAKDKEVNRSERLRERAWVSCLSKEYDNLLMWSYYTNHYGICIGLDMKKVAQCLHPMLGQLVYPEGMEVEYRDIIQKPDYFKEVKNYWYYQLCTKGKAWEHEHEVRMIIIEPYELCMEKSIPEKYNECKYPIPWNEVRFYARLSGACFETLYLGTKIDEEDKKSIIDLACKLNPDIKIYQMQPDPEAFRLVPMEI